MAIARPLTPAYDALHPDLGPNLTEQTIHQDLTINEGIGFQLA